MDVVRIVEKGQVFKQKTSIFWSGGRARTDIYEDGKVILHGENGINYEPPDQEHMDVCDRILVENNFPKIRKKC